jgi:hypothetical protein
MDDAGQATLSERADALERRMSDELDRYVVIKSVLFTSGERDPRLPLEIAPEHRTGGRMLMGDDPRLPKMPAAPTLVDFFRLRFGPAAHLLQSAELARKAGHPEKIVLACLVHDIANIGFIRGDHGFWGAQLVAPYVDAEVAWAIRAHQTLRFFADEANGYAYPQAYIDFFGADFRPEPYVVAEYKRLRRHRWYGTGRLITVNDIYAFDPNTTVELESFTDIIGRNFRQPKEGLGFDNSPSSHMWRTINRPTRFL